MLKIRPVVLLAIAAAVIIKPGIPYINVWSGVIALMGLVGLAYAYLTLNSTMHAQAIVWANGEFFKSMEIAGIPWGQRIPFRLLSSGLFVMAAGYIGTILISIQAPQKIELPVPAQKEAFENRVKFT